MSTTSKTRLLIAVLSLIATAAFADGIGSFDNGQGVFGALGFTKATSVPVSGALLLEDGVSILLLEDGTSHFCLEGGC